MGASQLRNQTHSNISTILEQEPSNLVSKSSAVLGQTPKQQPNIAISPIGTAVNGFGGKSATASLGVTANAPASPAHPSSLQQVGGVTNVPNAEKAADKASDKAPDKKLGHGSETDWAIEDEFDTFAKVKGRESNIKAEGGDAAIYGVQLASEDNLLKKDGKKDHKKKK